LQEDLDSDSERMILPTPVLSEFLIFVGKDGPSYLEKLSGMKTILVKPFEQVAGIELAALEVEDRLKTGKRAGSASPWAKLRFDRQIVANREDQWRQANILGRRGRNEVFDAHWDPRHRWFSQKRMPQIVQLQAFIVTAAFMYISRVGRGCNRRCNRKFTILDQNS
jgi:hypothetical protein